MKRRQGSGRSTDTFRQMIQLLAGSSAVVLVRHQIPGREKLGRNVG
jgi:hypothetical protein